MDINEKTVLIDNLITSTWYTIKDKIIDQVFQITPLFDKLVESGKITAKVPDGTHFEIPIQYAKQNQNRKWFGRGTEFSAGEKESLTRLLYYVRNVGTSIPRFFDDDRKNKGRAKLEDYANYKVESAKAAMMDGFETDLWVQNSDPLAMNALPTLVSTTPTVGTVGTMTRSSNDYLQNNIKDFTGLSTTANLLDEMTTMYNLCSIWKSGTSRFPDMIVTTREVYQDYERICRLLQQIVTNKTERASLGFGDLAFKNTEIFWAPECPAGCMYFLNTEHLELCYDPEVWFEMTSWKEGQGNIDRVAQILCSCNLTCDHFRKMGVIFNITTVTN